MLHSATFSSTVSSSVASLSTRPGTPSSAQGDLLESETKSDLSEESSFLSAASASTLVDHLQFPSLHQQRRNTVTAVRQPLVHQRRPIVKEDMSSMLFPMFGGDDNTESPREFWRRFTAHFASKTDEEWLKMFPNYLKLDSMADIWWEDLVALVGITNMTWKKAEEEFKKMWPSPPQEWEKKILELKLRKEDLGQTVMMEGVSVLSHVAWARQMEQLVKSGKVADKTTYLGIVYDGLPAIVQGEVMAPSCYANWLGFTSDVAKIDLQVIQTKLKNEKTARDELTRELSAQFRRLQVQSAPAPFKGGMRGGGAGRGAGRPVPAATAARKEFTEVERQQLANLVVKLVQYPNTPAGQAAYQKALAKWDQDHSGAFPTSYAQEPYPLKPGTAPVLSRECFRCGYTGHARADCKGEEVSRKEYRWRSICNNKLRKAQGETSAVRWVDIEDFEDQEGKEEGPLV
ncbi:hypothetical protein BDN72DRAFT_906453 [Pluteus cervinus]|uniref:Uncharacterized protein n=1 Tax=Pluteus cervinus TaxID=181527 RepID=A0ACD2ZZG8_9AGAR|nr:hypothetical protein BDN72DRAFT_906453 [Pluteus cervinus]